MKVNLELQKKNSEYQNEYINLKTQVNNNISNAANQKLKDFEEEKVDFQKKYLKEMKNLKIIFEKFKNKTYEDVFTL